MTSSRCGTAVEQGVPSLRIGEGPCPLLLRQQFRELFPQPPRVCCLGHLWIRFDGDSTGTDSICFAILCGCILFTPNLHRMTRAVTNLGCASNGSGMKVRPHMVLVDVRDTLRTCSNTPLRATDLRAHVNVKERHQMENTLRRAAGSFSTTCSTMHDVESHALYHHAFRRRE